MYVVHTPSCNYLGRVKLKVLTKQQKWYYLTCSMFSMARKPRMRPNLGCSTMAHSALAMKEWFAWNIKRWSYPDCGLGGVYSQMSFIYKFETSCGFIKGVSGRCFVLKNILHYPQSAFTHNLGPTKKTCWKI